MKPARMLRMRDLVIDEDLVEAGWEKWEAKRRKGVLQGNGSVGKKAR